MIKVIVSAYEYFLRHRLVCWSGFAMMSLLLLISLSRLTYNEDISDFLPLDADTQSALTVYQNASGANNLYAIVSSKGTNADKGAQWDNYQSEDADAIVEAIDRLCEKISESDTLHLISDITKEIELGQIIEVNDFVTSNMPLFLTDADYVRIDSLLTEPNFVADRLAQDKELLMFPSSALVGSQISSDPMGLFTPVKQRLNSHPSFQNSFELYDGHLLFTDHSRGIAIIQTAFGSSESARNRQLLQLLDEAAGQVESQFPNLEISIIGAPVIAVGNADRIKADSMWGILVAAILIIALLVYVFRKPWSILLIAISIGWGWLFALGIIGLFYESISLIVIGIASIIVGIAVNYPLHLIDHLRNRTDRLGALKEIVSPLVVGNITTVGAFMALIPLNSKALHDLGLFSALLLIGTILFVLLILPHLLPKVKEREKGSGEPRLITFLSSINPSQSKTTVAIIVALTCVFGYFSLRTEFDSDLRNINYIPKQQQDVINDFEHLFKSDSCYTTLYIVSKGATWDEALNRFSELQPSIDSLASSSEIRYRGAAANFLPSQIAQQKRLQRWNEFKAVHAENLQSQLTVEAPNAGFSPLAFQSFNDLLDTSHSPLSFEQLAPLTSTIFLQNIYEDQSTGEKFLIIDVDVPPEDLASVKSALNDREGVTAFDIQSMNASMANTITNEFNYIGAVCSLIVFVFLWLSMRSLKLAIISFIPMAVGWIWILGIMVMLGMQFNIVNIILATFIFGQGDDYTIFITEGLVYERRHGRPMLASYKNGIVVSALIMFIGIGVLAFAQHPALRSLGTVTVIGMATVVFMAYTLPPLLFRWLYPKSFAQVKR